MKTTVAAQLRLIGLLALLAGCSGLSAPPIHHPTSEERQLEQFITEHVAKVRPLMKAAALAHWQAAVSGLDADYENMKQCELAVRLVYTNRDEYAMLKKIRESGHIADPLLARQLDLLYFSYLPNQIEPDLLKQIVDLNARITQRFHTYRGVIEGTTVTLNDINKILTTDKDSHKREQAWRAGKHVGGLIRDDMLELIRLRNRAARPLGFDNFRTLSLTANEQDPAELDRIFAELDRLTAAPFARIKAELDSILARHYGLSPADLMPWHYHDLFFQRVPLVLDRNLDEYYRRADVKQLAQQFFTGIGLPVDDILARSDLYEKPGKDQHAFSTDIDREGDVRILCNLQNNEQWMETLLHELGHAVYSKNHDRSAPFLVRDAAHAFCTEAVAMFFGRLSRNPFWMQPMLGLSDAERSELETVGRRYLQFQQLIFARWTLVMFHFEKQLYANPEQDLDTLWWDLVERYQMLRRPDGPAQPDWASKLHFTVAPCYYHNYMLGELLASQWHHYIVRNVLGRESDAGVGFVGEKAVGEYFIREVFSVGARYPWNEMIRRATGEPLTPRHFAAQFVR
ncbi:MAG: M2 family metallopeptidase [Candidatus Sumerlaeia bacterium]|nr:M2 family metallopeptidase [Candidatus Sumerlaeia bacterium]